MKAASLMFLIPPGFSPAERGFVGAMIADGISQEAREWMRQWVN